MNISYGDKMLYIIVLLSLLSNIALSSYMTNVISNEGECVDKASNCLNFKDRCDVVSWLMNLCPETCLHPCIAMAISRNSMEAISKNKGGLPVISQKGLPAGRQSETPEIVTVPDCPEGFFQTGNSYQCFKYFNDVKRNFYDAKAKCEDENLRLAEPQDPINLRKYIINTYGNKWTYLGARGDDNTVKWLYGKDLEKLEGNTFWKDGEPGSKVGQNHCLFLMTHSNDDKYSNTPYSSNKCSDKRPILCEYVKTIPQQYTVYDHHFSNRQCRIIHGGIIQGISGVTLDYCEASCDDNVKCSAFNFKFNKGASKGSCVLRNCGHKPPYPIMESRDGWEGYTVDEIEYGFFLDGYSGPWENHFTKEQGCVLASGVPKLSDMTYLECEDWCNGLDDCDGFNFDIENLACELVACENSDTRPEGYLEQWEGWSDYFPGVLSKVDVPSEELSTINTDPWLNGGRCGPSYRLLNGRPGQCNPQGENPCCNKNTGWCGNTNKHCECKYCIDYRKEVKKAVRERPKFKCPSLYCRKDQERKLRPDTWEIVEKLGGDELEYNGENRETDLQDEVDIVKLNPDSDTDPFTQPGYEIINTDEEASPIDEPDYQQNPSTEGVCDPPCINGGWCNDQNVCLCKPGWEGTYCQLAYCEDECVNGRCALPNYCACHGGWTGTLCTEKCPRLNGEGRMRSSRRQCQIDCEEHQDCTVTTHINNICVMYECPRVCPIPWHTIPDSISCYLFSDGRKKPNTEFVTHTEAKRLCQQVGGYLASLGHKPADQDPLIIYNEWKGFGKTWVGAIKGESGKWTWQDGFQLTVGQKYTLWKNNEPSGDGACAEIDSDLHGMNAVSCTKKRKFVCENNALCADKCYYGECTLPFFCKCNPGWRGTRCNIHTCDTLCANGGRCIGPGLCECKEGWEGVHCNVPVCDPKCFNGRCKEPYTCDCDFPWTGALCRLQCDLLVTLDINSPNECKELCYSETYPNCNFNKYDPTASHKQCALYDCPSQSACSKPWRKIFGSNSCYYFSRENGLENRDQDKAEEYCEQIGGYLASLGDLQPKNDPLMKYIIDNKHIDQTYKSNTWVGAYKDELGKWRWQDTTEVAPQWSSRLNDQAGDGACAEIDVKAEDLNDLSCTQNSREFVCEISESNIRFHGPYPFHWDDNSGCDYLGSWPLKTNFTCKLHCANKPQCTGVTISRTLCTMYGCPPDKINPEAWDKYKVGWSKEKITAKLTRKYTILKEGYVYQDSQCRTIGEYPLGDLNDCKQKCDLEEKCTAFNFRPGFVCVLRACGRYPPYPSVQMPKHTESQAYTLTEYKLDGNRLADYYGPYGYEWDEKRDNCKIIDEISSATLVECEYKCDYYEECTGFNFHRSFWRCDLVACLDPLRIPTGKFYEKAPEGWSKKKITDPEPQPRCPSVACTKESIGRHGEYNKNCYDWPTCDCDRNVWCYFNCNKCSIWKPQTCPGCKRNYLQIQNE